MIRSPQLFKIGDAHPRAGEAIGHRGIAGLLVLAVLGCAPTSTDRLTIATNWDASACDRLERRITSELGPIQIRWIRVGEDEDPSRAADRPASIDVVLGGPLASFERLAIEGRLDAIDGRPWLTLGGDRPGFADALLAAGEDLATWAEAYARLVREFEPEAFRFVPFGGQGAGLMAGSNHAEEARALLETLQNREEAGPPPSALLLDKLLRATLGEAREELRAARVALERAGRPARSLALFTESPPWPPATITRMRSRPDGEALIATLIGQVAPDPSAREWLRASLDRPPRPIDGVMLDTLARAADGRLVADSRFRSWLRTEWTAWARQRYRRVVARLADPRYAPP